MVNVCSLQSNVMAVHVFSIPQDSIENAYFSLANSISNYCTLLNVDQFNVSS